jgi:hypothetical protein
MFVHPWCFRVTQSMIVHPVDSTSACVKHYPCLVVCTIFICTHRLSVCLKCPWSLDACNPHTGHGTWFDVLHEPLQNMLDTYQACMVDLFLSSCVVVCMYEWFCVTVTTLASHATSLRCICHHIGPPWLTTRWPMHVTHT